MIFPHPDFYHGRNRRPPFFEGWYFRLADAEGRRNIAVIPGIYRHTDPEENRSFILLFDADRHKPYFIPASIGDFRCESGMAVTIGESFFDRDLIRPEVRGDGIELTGEVLFEKAVRWPRGFLSPGVMGPYTHLPVMQCFYQVTAMTAGLSGELKLNGERINFTGGRGYIEKNWGRSFPDEWIWMQTNRFDDGSESAFMLSIASIPFPLRSFTGITGGLYHNGRFHRFATFRGARIRRLTVDDNRLSLMIAQGTATLEIDAEHRNPTVLPSPDETGMNGRIGESLTSMTRIRLSEGGSVVFENESGCLGMELSLGAGSLNR